MGEKCKSWWESPTERIAHTHVDHTRWLRLPYIGVASFKGAEEQGDVGAGVWAADYRTAERVRRAERRHFRAEERRCELLWPCPWVGLPGHCPGPEDEPGGGRAKEEEAKLMRVFSPFPVL